MAGKKAVKKTGTSINKVYKSFALSTLCGALIMSVEKPTLKMVTLKLQIDRAMRVFSAKVGSKVYNSLSYRVQEIWTEVAKQNDNVLLEEEIEVFIRMMLSLAPQNQMRSFLGYTFTSNAKLRDEAKSALLVAVNEIDDRLNEELGTKKTASRQSIGEVMTPPLRTAKAQKPKKQKPKKTKTSSGGEKKLTRNQRKERERRARAKGFLREKIADIKKKYENTGHQNEQGGENAQC